ncbi:MAG TPA: hypothetical protein PK252_10860 [Bacteroidales bacterium]|nr:hypothetical protein [Bacteroidales bacterium]
MNKFIRYAFLLCISISLFSCKGEKGDKGDPGDMGNANVKSIIFDVKPSNWQGDSSEYYVFFDVKEINQEIFSNGAVLLYILRNEGSSNQSFNALPYTWVYENAFEYLDYDVFLGKIKISYRMVDNGINTTTLPDETFTFKVVVLTGN